MRIYEIPIIVRYTYIGDENYIDFSFSSIALDELDDQLSSHCNFLCRHCHSLLRLPLIVHDLMFLIFRQNFSFASAFFQYKTSLLFEDAFSCFLHFSS